MRLPDFIVIGAQKSGTTALFTLLAQHPGIYIPAQKEVQFFSNNTLYEKGTNWYSDNYYSNINHKKKCGDISPQYMFYKSVPKRIYDAIPDVKLIAILRNPVDRAYSHYNMSIRRGQEDRDFDSAFECSVNKEMSCDKDIIESNHYYGFSDYSGILSFYLKYFKKSQILILFQEDLSTKPLEVLDEIYKFIDVSRTYIPRDPKKRIHQAGVKIFPGLEIWFRNRSVFKDMLKYFFPTKWRGFVRFKIEQINLKPMQQEKLTPAQKQTMVWLTRKQDKFLNKEFDIKTPWL